MGGKGRAVAPGGNAANGRRQRAGGNEERRRSRRGLRRRGARLRQGVAAEIGAGADLAIAVGEEGDGHAVDERYVNGDGTAEARYRSGNSVQPERGVNALESLPLLSDGAGTLGRSRGPSRSSRSVRGERGVVCARRVGPRGSGSGLGLPEWFCFHLLDDVGDADHRFAKRCQRGLVSRIDVDAGGAGLDSVIRVTQRVGACPR